MDKYLTVEGNTQSEKVIEKSRFITYSRHVEGDEAAKKFISEINALHSLATHVCYAYIADKTGNLMRFSDNGEPQGTAGMPILEVIKNKKLYETAIAVVRYFGGIKLGSGGLVRAYSSSAAENLSVARIKLCQMGSEIKIYVSYPFVPSLKRFLDSSECVQKDTAYADNVCFTLVVKSEQEEKFLSSLIDYMSGKVTVKKVGEYFYCF